MPKRKIEHTTQLSASTTLCRFESVSGSFEGSSNLVLGGGFGEWKLYGGGLGSGLAPIPLYNQQRIDISGLTVDEKMWKSTAIRVEQPEPVRGNFGQSKTAGLANPSPYGFLREYHLFTTKELDPDIDIAVMMNLTNPTLPTFTSANGTSSRLNENQLIYGICNEYNSMQNVVATPEFALDWRLVPSYSNVIGSGAAVAQDHIYYTRVIYCFMDSTDQSPPERVQGIDIPYCRVSLIGSVVEPTNQNDLFATLANNSGVVSW
jgi:hypothetical protein